MSYYHFMVAVSFDSEDLSLVEEACRLAAKHKVRLSIVTVQPAAGPSVTAASALKPNRAPNELRDRLAEMVAPYGIQRAHCHALVGGRAQEIAGWAHRHLVDLLVVGTHQRDLLERVVGTSATEFLRDADCDLLGVRIGTENKNGPTIIAVEGDRDTAHFLNRATQFLAEDRDVRVLHVTPSISEPTAAEIQRLTENTPLASALRRSQTREQQEILSAMAEVDIDKNRLMLRSGDLLVLLPDIVNTLAAKCLIVSTSHHRRLGWALASTTNAILHNADCNTLVVRPPA